MFSWQLTILQTSTIPCFSTVTRCLLSSHACRQEKSFILPLKETPHHALAQCKKTHLKFLKIKARGIFSFPLIVETMVRRRAKIWDWSRDWRSRGQMTELRRDSQTNPALHPKALLQLSRQRGRWKPLKLWKYTHRDKALDSRGHSGNAEVSH